MKIKVLVTLVIGTLIFVSYFCIVNFFYPDMSQRAYFGDMFGALNTAFSGLAFMALIYTLLLQQEELRLQREELKATRAELKRTAEAQEKSEEALSKQAASLKVTAKLNGLSARLQHQNTLIEMTNSAKYGISVAQFNAEKKQADNIINEIIVLTEDK